MRSRRTPISLVLALFVVAGWPAQALAKAIGRFVHTVPGAGPVLLTLTGSNGTSPLGRAAFGEASPYGSIPTGSVAWQLTGADSKVFARGRARLGPGAYTIVAVRHRTGVALRFFRNVAGARDGARVRLIHAAPELGAPDLRLGDRLVARNVPFGRATPYLKVAPGVYTVAATAPHSTDSVVSRSGVRLAPGTSSTGLVVGTAGERARIVVFADRTLPAAPAHPPRAAEKASAARPRATIAHRAPAAGHSAHSVAVHRGDSLWSIARRQVGAGASNERVQQEVRRLWAANARKVGTGDPNLIFPGQHLSTD